MPINIECPKCQAQLAAPDHAAGKQVRCKGCTTVMLVPNLEPPVIESDFDIIEDTPAPPPPPVKLPPPPAVPIPVPLVESPPAPVASAFDFDAPVKKPKKKAIVEDDDDEDEVPAKPAPVTLPAPGSLTNAFDFDAPIEKSKKSKKKTVDDDEEDEEEEKPKKSKKKAVVEDEEDDDEPAKPAPVPPPPPVSIPAPAFAPAPAASAFEFDAPDEKPKKSKKHDDDDDEDEKPKKKSKMNLVDDDEEDEKPRKKSKRDLNDDEASPEKKSKLPLFIGLGVGGFVLLIALGVGGYLIFGKGGKSTEVVKSPTSKTTKTSDTRNTTPPTTAIAPKSGGIPPGWVVYDQPDFTCWLKQSGIPPQTSSKPNELGDRPEYNLAKFNSSNRSHMVTIIPLPQSMDVVRAKQFMDQEVERRINLQVDRAKIDKRKDVPLDKQTAQEWVAISEGGDDTGTYVYRFFLDRNRIFILSAGGNGIPESDSYITDFFRSFKLKN